MYPKNIDIFNIKSGENYRFFNEIDCELRKFAKFR